MATTWAQLELVTPEDVLSEVHHVESLVRFTQNTTGVEDAILMQAIDKAKNRTRQKLAIHIYDTWDTTRGYCTASLLDTALDRIANPEELKPYAVAVTILGLLAYGQTVEAMQTDLDTYMERHKHWTAEAKDRLADALKLIRIDPFNTSVSEPVSGHAFSRA